MSPCVILLIALGLTPQQPPAGATAQPPAPQAPAPAADSKPDAGRPVAADEEPIVTRHEVRAGGRTLKYTATAGFLPVRNATTGDLEARSAR
jgi:carboxypeptidase C (cathepsin A)